MTSVFDNCNLKSSQMLVEHIKIQCHWFRGEKRGGKSPCPIKASLSFKIKRGAVINKSGHQMKEILLGPSQYIFLIVSVIIILSAVIVVTTTTTLSITTWGHRSASHRNRRLHWPRRGRTNQNMLNNNFHDENQGGTEQGQSQHSKYSDRCVRPGLLVTALQGLLLPETLGVP